MARFEWPAVAEEDATKFKTCSGGVVVVAATARSGTELEPGMIVVTLLRTNNTCSAGKRTLTAATSLVHTRTVY